MENREILIANTKTQTRSKITTDATTLGELKAALDNANIDYSGMTFTEGISKTQLLDDATQLPQNLMYKGKATNNLVILLTNTKKNISSGIYAGDRKACYSIIKENNLQEDVKEYFGRNFTQVPTTDLQNFIEERIDFPSDVDIEEDKKQEEDDTVSINKDREMKIQVIADMFVALVKAGILLYDDLEDINSVISRIMDDIKDGKKINNHQEKTDPVSTSDGIIDDNDIDDMLNALEL